MTKYLTANLFGAPSQVDSSSGLVAYWDMNLDGGTTGTVYDLSQNSYNGTNSGATAIEGKIGAGMSFDSLSDKVTTTAEIAGTGDDSVSAWVYVPTTLGNERLQIVNNGKFILEAYGYGVHRILFTSDGSTNVSAGDGSLLYGQWLHIVVTRTSAGVANFYVNGTLTGSANQVSGTPASGTTNMILGNRNAGDQGFRGTIDEVRLYNKILSTDEITALYNEGANPGKVVLNSQSADTSLIGWWPLGSGEETLSETNLVTNGSFDSNITGWDDYVSRPVEVFEWQEGGSLHANNTTDWGEFCSDDNVAVVSGRKYKISFEATKTGTSTMYIQDQCYGTSRTSQEIVNGINTVYWTPTTTENVVFSVLGGSAYELTIDDISIREIQTEDLSISGNNGSIIPGSSSGYVTDQHGNAGGAYDFDGSATYINLGDPDNYLPDMEYYSVSGWFKADVAGSNKSIIEIRGDALMRLVIQSDLLEVVHTANAGTGTFTESGSTPINDAAWHHFLIIKDGDGTNKLKVYLDGSLEITFSYNVSSGDAGTNSSSLGALSVATTPAWFFNGQIADVRVYNRVLSADEITELYNSYNPSLRGSSNTKGLVGHWPLTLETERPGGTDILAGWDFTSGWNKSPGITSFIDNNTFSYTGNGYIYSQPTVAGKRYKMNITGTTDPSTTAFAVESTNIAYINSYPISGGNLSATFDFTARSTYLNIHLLNGAGEATITSMTVEEMQAGDMTEGGIHGGYGGVPEVGTLATKFDGSSQYIDIGDTAQTAVKTISFWTQADDITSHTDYPIDLNGTDYISIVDGEVTLGGFAGGTNTIYTDSVSAEATIPDVTGWHHVVITSTTGRNASDMDIARLEGTGYHDGKIADVKMWDRALSATEVTQLYAQGRPTSSTDYAANFNGTSQYFSLTDSGSAGSAEDFDMGTEDFALEFWIKNSVSNSLSLLTKKADGSAITKGYEAYVYSGSFYFELSDGTNSKSFNAGSMSSYNNTYSHFFLVADKDTGYYVYKNGGNVASSTDVTNIGDISTTDELRIGKRGGGGAEYVTGPVAKMRVYKFGVGGLPTDIATLAAENAGKMGKITSGLQSYLVDGWDFDGSGFALKDPRHDLTNNGVTTFVKVR